MDTIVSGYCTGQHSPLQLLHPYHTLTKAPNCEGRIVTIINAIIILITIIIIIISSIIMPILQMGKQIQRLNNLPRQQNWEELGSGLESRSLWLAEPGQGLRVIHIGMALNQSTAEPDTNMLCDLEHIACLLWDAISLSVKQERGTASSLAPCSFVIVPLSEGMQVENGS